MHDPQPRVGNGAAQHPLLEVAGVAAGYGRRPVLHDMNLRLEPGEVVGILGHNGAGKTTLLKTILGAVRTSAGTIRYNGAVISGRSAVRNAQEGIILIPAEHYVFADLTVAENLRLAGHRTRNRAVTDRRLQRVRELFPVLADRDRQAAGTMSGGQQRMLGIGIALMAGPRLLLLDEPSLGLAPALVEQMMDVIGRLAVEEGLGVLLVEQNVLQALTVVQRAYFIRSGRIILAQSGEELRRRDSYWDLF